MKWPKVSAVSNPNGDWSVQVEHGGPVIADLSQGVGQHRRLVGALRGLQEKACQMTCNPKAHAEAARHTNSCDRARAVLASDSGHGCTETDSATQERNAKRIAAALDGIRHLREERSICYDAGGVLQNAPRLLSALDAVLADAEDAG